MPFQSEAQRRFMWSRHPDIARSWAAGKSSVTGRKEPRRGTKAAKGHRGIGGGTRNLPYHKRKSTR